MSWLSGWDKRIKLTIDYSKIDAALSHFPVTVILSSTHGDCVFDELTQDANRKKIAFTKSDGITQLYGEIEKWDDANESAIIHVSLSGWDISSSADTDFYMYYDVDHADNDSYIGDIDSTPGHSVWDSNFKFVGHMVDATTSTTKDSTSNGNDGTKLSANNPIEAAGKVGKGQDFDGANDYIGFTTVTQALITLECLSYQHAKGDGNYPRFFEMPGYILTLRSQDAADPKMTCHITSVRSTSGAWSMPANDIIYNTQYHLAVTYDSESVDNNPLMYRNGESRTVTEKTTPIGSQVDNAGTGYLGNRAAQDASYDGVLDEIRISNSIRSTAWIKATYNTLWDTLLTYGSEEMGFVPRVIMF